MLKLTEKLYISEGNSRVCYIHPNNNNLCIKINKDFKRSNQNTPEYYYLKLKKNKSALQKLPKCIGLIDTNLGDGLVYELIKDYDGNRSKSLAYYYKKNEISKPETQSMIMELYHYCLKSNILIYDANMSNILLQKLDNDHINLRIIDGFGGRKLNINLIFRIAFKYFSKKKTIKSFNHLLFRLENYTPTNDPNFLSE